MNGRGGTFLKVLPLCFCIQFEVDFLYLTIADYQCVHRLFLLPDLNAPKNVYMLISNLLHTPVLLLLGLKPRPACI